MLLMKNLRDPFFSIVKTIDSAAYRKRRGQSWYSCIHINPESQNTKFVFHGSNGSDSDVSAVVFTVSVW